MLIYDKNGDKIEIIEMIGKSEEIKKYRKNVLSRYKDNLVYNLITNNRSVAYKFDRMNEVSLDTIVHDYYDPLGPNDYSELRFSEFEEDVIERYIAGMYDELDPIGVFKFNRDFKKVIVYNFLRTRGFEEKEINCHRSWEFNGLLNLPLNLQLLQLLILGKYEKLVSQNIGKQLSMFEFNHLRSVKLSDFREMLNTGLVQGSIDDMENRAIVGGKILAKRK